MKRLDDLKWEIGNSELIRLNKARIKLNEDSELHEYQIFDSPLDPVVVNPYTLRRIRRRIKEVKKKAEAIKSRKLPQFDRIVLRDIKETVCALESYHSYFNPEKLEDVNTKLWAVLSGLFGTFYENSVYNKLIKMFVSGIDHKMHDKYSKIMSKIESHSHDTDLERIRKQAKEMVPHFIETAKSFVQETGLYDRDLEFIAELTPATQTSSWWSPEMEQMCLDAARMNFIRINQKEKFFGGVMYIIAIHEYAHALQEHFSKNALPDGMNAKQKGMNYIVQGMVSEGTACSTEKPALIWLNKNRKKLNLSKLDINLMSMLIPMYLQTKVPQICHDLFELKGRLTQKDFDAHNELAKISGQTRYKTDPYIFDDNPATTTFFQINYILGSKYVSNLLTELRREYGTGFVRKNIPVIMRGMLTASALRPNAHRQFMLKEYLPKAKNHLK